MLGALGTLFTLDRWTVRRAQGRFGPAVRTLLLVTGGYLILWVVTFAVASGLVASPHSPWPAYVTVPMVVIAAPWVISWMPAQYQAGFTIRSYRRLGMRRGAWPLFLIGAILAIVQLALCFGVLFATFA